MQKSRQGKLHTNNNTAHASSQLYNCRLVQIEISIVCRTVVQYTAIYD